MDDGMKWIFKQEVRYEGQPYVNVIKETDAIDLDDVLDEFESFLRGCGFSFDGSIVIEED